MTNEKLLTTKELADKFNVHTNSVYNWRKEGMPYVIAGRNCRYDYEEVKQWLKDNKGGK